jgi:hypothetical protein
MLLSRQQIVGQELFDNVAQFKYFVTSVTNQNLIPEKIKGGFNSYNA